MPILGIAKLRHGGRITSLVLAIKKGIDRGSVSGSLGLDFCNHYLALSLGKVVESANNNKTRNGIMTHAKQVFFFN